MPGLKAEARVKLKKIQPRTFGQAARISGINPTDVALLQVHTKRGKTARWLVEPNEPLPAGKSSRPGRRTSSRRPSPSCRRKSWPRRKRCRVSLSEQCEDDPESSAPTAISSRARFATPTARSSSISAAIDEFCADEGEDFDDEVRLTYLHELGHHLGWDEGDLEARGLG